MTRRLRVLPPARKDLAELSAYIARDDPYAADRLLDRLREESELLFDFPGIGTIDRKRSNRRVYPVDNYLIFYREDPDGITVLRYLHGRRDFRRIT